MFYFWNYTFESSRRIHEKAQRRARKFVNLIHHSRELWNELIVNLPWFPRHMNYWVENEIFQDKAKLMVRATRSVFWLQSMINYFLILLPDDCLMIGVIHVIILPFHPLNLLFWQSELYKHQLLFVDHQDHGNLRGGGGVQW